MAKIKINAKIRVELSDYPDSANEYSYVFTRYGPATEFKYVVKPNLVSKKVKNSDLGTECVLRYKIFIDSVDLYAVTKSEYLDETKIKKAMEYKFRNTKA